MKIRSPDIKYWVEGSAHHLDVRPILEAGGEPFPFIMDAVSQLEGEHSLVLHALFDPAPLRRQFERMGLPQKVEQLEKDHWIVMVGPRAKIN